MLLSGSSSDSQGCCEERQLWEGAQGAPATRSASHWGVGRTRSREPHSFLQKGRAPREGCGCPKGRGATDRTPGFPDQGARELSSFCLGRAEGADTKDGEGALPELCPSLAQLGETESPPGTQRGLVGWSGTGALPNPWEEGQSLSLKGLFDALPEVSMNWACTRHVLYFSKLSTGHQLERKIQVEGGGVVDGVEDGREGS